MGDLTAAFAPVVGNLTPRFVKSPVFPHPGVGHEIDKCIIVASRRLVLQYRTDRYSLIQQSPTAFISLAVSGADLLGFT